MSRPTRAEIRRRRAGAAVFVLLLVAAIGFVATPHGRGRDGATAGSSPTGRAGSAAPTSDPATTRVVPAWLAWMNGGFPDGFATQAAAIPDLGTTVVVAGDTLWMSSSHSADGAVVDRPAPPYEIPLDSFSVNPSAYAPFLPKGEGATVTGALARGDAVLGQSSADLRRLGVGGTITIGATTLTVGAVVPDDLVGWSELMVSRDVGARLGIAHDRYLLALGSQGLTLPRFAADISALLPSGTPVRTAEPGGVPFVRVASGTDPPVVLKQVFGEFDAYPSSTDPAVLNMDPAWHDAHIVTRTVPILGQVTCNRALMPALQGALQELAAEGLDRLIHVYSGCYAPRTVARSPTAPPSYHAYGAAIDIDAPTNGYGDTTPAMDPRVVAVFERWGFDWGGDFLVPDAMHFEYGGPPASP